MKRGQSISWAAHVSSEGLRVQCGTRQQSGLLLAFFSTKDASGFCPVGLQKSFCKCMLLFHHISPPHSILLFFCWSCFLCFEKVFGNLSVTISALSICFLFSFFPPRSLNRCSVGEIRLVSAIEKCCCFL